MSVMVSIRDSGSRTARVAAQAGCWQLFIVDVCVRLLGIEAISVCKAGGWTAPERQVALSVWGQKPTRLMTARGRFWMTIITRRQMVGA